MARLRPAFKFFLFLQLFNLSTFQLFNPSTFQLFNLTAHAAELPTEYTRLEHIVAPRGAYIDTGYKPNQNTRVVMDVTVQGTTEYWFGCWDTDYNKGAFAFGNDGTGIYAGYGNRQGGTFGSVVANGRRLVELDRNVLRVNGKQIHAFETDTFGPLAQSLYLFAQNRKGEMVVLDAQDTIICHGCTIYEGGTLKRNFVPCVRTADNVVGLYDKVEGRFYANAGQGAFDKPSRLINLPKGYRLLDSLEVPRGAYIDTGYRPNQNVRALMDVTVKSTSEYWFGCWDTDYNKGAFALGNDGTSLYAGYGDDGGPSGSVVRNGRHMVELDRNVAKADGVMVGERATASDDFQLKNNLYLFGQNRKGTLGVAANQNTIFCHGCRIYEDGILKRDFVPCKNASGARGLYDCAKGVFYPLSYKLPAGYVATENIVAPRGAYINTGYKPNQNSCTMMDVTVQGTSEYWFSVSGTSYTTDAYALCNDYDLGIYYAVDDSGGSFKSEKTADGCVPNGRHTVGITPYSMLVDGEVWATKEQKGNFRLTKNLYLFASNGTGNPYTRTTQTSIICHGCTIYEGETLKRNFVPCVRTADIVAGLYDTVEDKFYANAGTGAFGTAGSAMPLNRTLSDGVYAVDTSFAFFAPPAESALKVAEGATVALYIPEGVTVALRGGDAVGQTGAGAGIEVPISSTLIVTGGGVLVATGGKAADGARGGAAEASQTLDEYGSNIHNMHYEDANGSVIDNITLVVGAGGAGGAGGGGAGAGIGGAGGAGGAGGVGGTGFSRTGFDNVVGGNDGLKGVSGGIAGSFGRFYAFGTVNVTARGGEAGALGLGGNFSSLQCTWSSSYYYPAYGSGGGGGGGGGSQAEDLGYGGPGGGGGGGGGTGCCTWYGNDDDWPIGYDHSGRGGIGGANGTLSENRGNGQTGGCQKGESISFHGEQWEGDYRIGFKGTNPSKGYPGSGGNGGSSGILPVHSYDSGIYRSANATVNKNEVTCKDANVTQHVAIKYTVTFSNVDKLLVSAPAAKTVYLGMPMPKVDPSTTVDEAQAMKGWYDAPEGGTMYYDKNGNPVFAAYDYYKSDLTLYPQVGAAAMLPTGVRVNGFEIGKDAAPTGCVFGVATRLSGAGPFTLSGENLNGLVRFVVAGDQPVAITLDGLHLKNERKNIGLIDISSGSSATITLKGTANYLEATGESSSAIHCPTGATVKIEGGRDMTTIDHNAESTHLRQMILHNDWTVNDVPFEFECDSNSKGEVFDLVLKSGPGAAAIGGNRNENCGDITLNTCDLSLTPNGGVLPGDPATARLVHEIGDGLMDASGDVTLGGHVTFINVPAMKCPIRPARSAIDTLTLSRPRPHDEYGVPLTPVVMWGNWIVFFRPGVVNINGTMCENLVIPRSGNGIWL